MTRTVNRTVRKHWIVQCCRQYACVYKGICHSAIVSITFCTNEYYPCLLRGICSTLQCTRLSAMQHLPAIQSFNAWPMFIQFWPISWLDWRGQLYFCRCRNTGNARVKRWPGMAVSNPRLRQRRQVRRETVQIPLSGAAPKCGYLLKSIVAVRCGERLDDKQPVTFIRGWFPFVLCTSFHSSLHVVVCAL